MGLLSQVIKAYWIAPKRMNSVPVNDGSERCYVDHGFVFSGFGFS